MKQVTIVGAGLSGLTAAIILAREGYAVTVLEQKETIGGAQCGAAGVRLDDMISGVAVYGNVFERCGDALFGGVQVHGGKENLIDGNLFLDCPAGISFSRWGQKRWLNAIGRFLEPAAAAAGPDR